MPQENVEIVRQVFEAFNSRHWPAWESHHHPDFEWSDRPEFPGGGTHRGVGGVRRFMDDVLETGVSGTSRSTPSKASARSAY